jgi:hypothetical protein
MKFILAASPAVLLASAVLVSPALAQTWSQPYPTQPTVQPYAGTTASPFAGATTDQPYTGAAATTPTSPGASTPLTSQASLPQGPYLQECREVRMLEGTLTAFCPKGDGTWHTTQLIGAERCSGNVHSAGGDLVCEMAPQIGSTAPPQGYVSSAGGTYAGPVAAPPYSPVLPAPVLPAPAYAVPVYPSIPSQNLYTSPSAARTAQPWGY